MQDVSRSLLALSLHRSSEALAYCCGCALFGLLCTLSIARTCWLPQGVAFALLIVLPWRVLNFSSSSRRWAFFLVDFCYFVNLGFLAFLAAEPWLPPQTSQGLQASVYVICEGPLAAALIAWKCAWVFSDAQHTISVLIHLLPGLAMFAKHFHGTAQPSNNGNSASSSCSELPWACGPAATEGLPHSLGSLREKAVWLGLVPLLFYLAWQLVYFLIVQVACRQFIQSHGYDTSYKALARRGHKGGAGPVYDFVRRGSTTRRVMCYGLVQLAFSIVWGAWAALTYHSYPLALLWQVVKFVVPLHHGAHYQLYRMPEQALARALEALATQGIAAAKADTKEAVAEYESEAGDIQSLESTQGLRQRRRQEGAGDQETTGEQHISSITGSHAGHGTGVSERKAREAAVGEAGHQGHKTGRGGAAVVNLQVRAGPAHAAPTPHNSTTKAVSAGQGPDVQRVLQALAAALREQQPGLKVA